MKKRRLLLSGVSILLMLCLLAGGTMAWFTDTEKVNADFTAGVLDITVEPGKDAETPLSFDNLRPMEYEKFLAEINQAGNGNVSVDGYDPKPVYFQPVVVNNAGTLPVYIELSVEALDMKNVECPEDGEKKIEIVKDAQGRETIKQSYHPDHSNVRVACTNGLADVLKLVLFEKVNGSWTVVSDNLNPDSNGKPYTPAMVLPAASGTQTYVIGAYLPDTAGNEYQGKHFHGDVVVKAFQTDEGAGAADMATVQWVMDGKVIGSYLVLFPEGETTMTLTPDLSKLGAGYELVDPNASKVVSKTDKTASFEVKLQEDGDGSSVEEAIWVRSAEELMNIGNGLDKFYRLGGDIDLSDYNWEPIGGEKTDETFTGGFDGCGYRITGLNIGQDEQTGRSVKTSGQSDAPKYAGLFAYCDGAELKNIVIEAPQVKTSEFGGALVGCANNTRIENCTVNGGTIVWDDTKGSCKLGGLVGDLIGSDSIAKNCSVSAEVTAVGTAKSTVNVGGLVGELYFGTIDGCTFTGNVQMTGSTKEGKTIAVGGLAGWLLGTATDSHVEGKVTNQSTGTAGKIYVGGLAGMLSDPAKDCTVEVEVQNAGKAEEVYVGQVSGNTLA